MTGYSCVACGARQSVDFAGYTCPRCRNNLDIVHDYALIRRTLTPREIISGYRNDLFQFERLLPVQAAGYGPLLRTGATPLLPAPYLAAAAGLRHLYLKDEGRNPTGSVKDRACSMTITRARETGAAVVACASTGNLAASLSGLAAGLVMPCVAVVPYSAPQPKVAQITATGAHLLPVRGTYDDAFALCAELCENRGWFNATAGYNPYTREGLKTICFELTTQLHGHAPDRVIVPAGNGNLVGSVWKGFRECRDLGLIPRCPRIDCVQAEDAAGLVDAIDCLREGGSPDPGATDWTAVPVSAARGRTVADALCISRPLDAVAAMRAVVESGGEAVRVGDDAILDAVDELARLAGLFVEPAAAVAWAGLRRLTRERRIDPAERMVCLLTGTGLKRPDIARQIHGAPRVIDPDFDEADRVLSRAGL